MLAVGEAIDDYLGNVDITADPQAVYDLDGGENAKKLKSAGYNATEVAGALAEVYELGETEAEQAALVQFLKGAGFAPNEVALAVQATLAIGANGIALAMRTAGYGATTVAGALVATFSSGPAAVAASLAMAGYGATAATTALVATFPVLGPAEIVPALAFAAYSATQVTRAMESVFNLGDTQAELNQIARLLRDAGYDATQVAEALETVFNLDVSETVQTLKGGGYGATPVARALERIHNFGPDLVAANLKGANYAASATAGALKTVFDLGSGSGLRSRPRRSCRESGGRELRLDAGRKCNCRLVHFDASRHSASSLRGRVHQYPDLQSDEG